MTGNTKQRLLFFFTGIPAFILAVLFLPFWNNALLFLVITILQIMAIYEIRGIFRAQGILVDPIRLSIFSLATSSAVYASSFFSRGSALMFSSLEILVIMSMISLLFITGQFAFIKKEDFASALTEISASVFSFFYTGILGAFIVYLATCFPQKKEPVFLFTLMTFGNDSLAWLFGVTLGKHRGLLDVSPNKSIAGFIGGFSGSILAGVLGYFLFPEAGFSSILSLLFMGAVMGAAVIVGDLFESALKRSANVKDSGLIVPGRGGILDSSDSLLFSAPIFVLLSLLFGFFR
ncbi:MAG: phosphatidate cytidylyltransferase [Spirochaetia bacterium]|nr:phosphatidate cytidylyltransferase [Spirochaetia bacterium]